MLQVLCQLLGTSNLEDVQSWLVSASPAGLLFYTRHIAFLIFLADGVEKEQARSMINAALRGLKESERASPQVDQSVDFNALSNFVER